MNRILFFTCFLTLLVTSFSCKKEVSSEPPPVSIAKGSLRSNDSDECLPKTVAGAYVAKKVLNDSNFIEVEINVLKAGSYTISTETINGYSFKATGNVTATGSNTIKLKGQGTPTSSGTNTFTVRFDTTFCYIQVVVLPEGNGGTAVFTLQGSGSNCLDANIQGIYMKNTPVTINNKVVLKVNVTTIGTYSISTSTINGITFSGTGTFATTGVQTVTVNASGTPVNMGNTVVTVAAGTSSCTFTLLVAEVFTPPLPTDIFPMTAYSWWSYDVSDPTFPGDSLLRVNKDLALFGFNYYWVYQENENQIPRDSSYYRKYNSDYYERTLTDAYGSFFFDTEATGEILFLKETMTNGQTWSTEFTGTISGQPAKIRYNYTVTAANTTATINGHPFTGVYKLSLQPQVNINNAGYTNDPLTYEFWYAKGVGMVYARAGTAPNLIEFNIRYWQVF
jgi:hypothetical protein